MIEETNCEEVNKKIRATIDKIIEKFKSKKYGWKGDRHVHYDFFKFLFDAFHPEQIKRNFVWEYRKVGPNSRTIALVMFCGKGKMVAVDFKFIKSPGDKVTEALIKHIEIQYENEDSLFKGYVVPLYYCPDDQAEAPKQDYNMTYQELLSKIVKQSKESIKDQRIELISDGVMPLDKK